MPVDIVIGLAYGDEGKGATVNYLAHENKADLIVRFNGGAQAAHNVHYVDGFKHTYSQFGAGSITKHGLTPTYLSQFHVLSPFDLHGEWRELKTRNIVYDDLLYMMLVNENTQVATPYHVAMSQYKIKKTKESDTYTGSCGVDVGTTLRSYEAYPEYAIYAKDMSDKDTLRKKLDFWRDYSSYAKYSGIFNDHDGILDYCVDFFYDLARYFRVISDYDWNVFRDDYDYIIFEGAQGVQLDKEVGTVPYVTSTRTTYHNANLLLHEYKGEVTRYGAMRTYLTRHGPGPFVDSEIEDAEDNIYNEKDNEYNLYQGHWRQAPLDIRVISDSINKLQSKPDYISLSHCDLIKDTMTLTYTDDGMFETTRFARDTDTFIATLERKLNIPVKLTGYGPIYEQWRQV